VGLDKPHKMAREDREMTNAPTNPIEAVTLGLTLALTAPTDEKARACAAMADQIAVSAGLTADQVDQCKATALQQAGF
jgi:hypothetical protein